MILLCKKLGFDVEKLSDLDCQIVESCDEDFEINSLDFVIFTCPALYHKTKHNNCEVLDLRVLKAFKNSEVVAKAILTSELVRAEREVEVVETGEDVVYVGDNLDIISELASNCNLTVITQNKETIKKLYPYEVRVVEGVVIDIKGKMGDFEVMVDGVDLTNGRRVDVVRAGQVIYPDWKKGREGIYTGNEYRGAFKALANLGSFIKLKTIVVNPDVCGVMKSGFPGCSLCFDCPTGSIELNEKLERVEVRFENCVGCGFCASICPLSAIENKLIPSDLIIEKIDAIADRFDDFGEYQLFRYSERVIASAVEAFVVNTSEVSDTRNGNRDQTVEKFVHSVAAEGNAGTDGHTSTQLKVRNVFSRNCFHSFLTGNCRKLFNGAVEQFLIGDSSANTLVQRNFNNFRNLHYRTVIELLHHCRYNLVQIFFS
jgi:ferredoxin